MTLLVLADSVEKAEGWAGQFLCLRQVGIGISKKARRAAAGVLVWPVLRQNKVSAASYVMNGIDVTKIPEVRAELRTLRRFAAKHRES
jgi:hypothetical protein